MAFLTRKFQNSVCRMHESERTRNGFISSVARAVCVVYSSKLGAICLWHFDVMDLSLIKDSNMAMFVTLLCEQKRTGSSTLFPTTLKYIHENKEKCPRNRIDLSFSLHKF